MSNHQTGNAPGPNFAPVPGGGPGVMRCSTCRTPAEKGHAPACDAVLALCACCKRPVIRVNRRPAHGAEWLRCGKCGTVQTAPSSLCAPLIAVVTGACELGFDDPVVPAEGGRQ